MRTDGTYNPFPNYEYTGRMRPVYPLSAKRTVPDHIPRPDYVAAGGKRFTLALTTLHLLLHGHAHLLTSAILRQAPQ